MLMLFNRRELITLSDNGLYMDIKQILQEEGIPNYTKFISGGGTVRCGIHGGDITNLFFVSTFKEMTMIVLWLQCRLLCGTDKRGE